jgi:hypothetical protein
MVDKYLPFNQKYCKKTLFVFYTTPTKSWKYDKFPDGWEWIGSGRTCPIGTKEIQLHTREEQFDGPEKSKEEMTKFLKQTFENLKKQNVIESYKIRETYV